MMSSAIYRKGTVSFVVGIEEILIKFHHQTSNGGGGSGKERGKTTEYQGAILAPGQGHGWFCCYESQYEKKKGWSRDNC